MIKYQQGDVVLTTMTPNEIKEMENSTVKSDPEDNSWSHASQARNEAFSKRQNTTSDAKCILALGEHTGHHHRFEASKMNGFIAESIYANYDRIHEPSYVRISETKAILGDGPMLYHEEHNPITIPPGVYKKTIVREFDHLTLDTRRVVD